MGDQPGTWLVTLRPARVGAPADSPPASPPGVPHAGPGADVDVAAAHLWQAGAVAVTTTRDAVVGTFDRQPPAGRRGPGGWVRIVEALPPTDHMASWRAWARPVTAGPFRIVPAHLAGHGDDAHETITIASGMAFGTGHHETTAGCLAAMADLPLRGRRVADVGTGTGILAIGALLLGAREVVAVDVDPGAVDVARANAAANAVSFPILEGSVDALDGAFDVVLANLLTGALVDLAPALYAVTSPGGWLVASGTSVAHADAVAAALAAAGFEAVDVRPGREWAVLVARRGIRRERP